jgi:hypothetical protein
MLTAAPPEVMAPERVCETEGDERWSMMVERHRLFARIAVDDVMDVHGDGLHAPIGIGVL